MKRLNEYATAAGLSLYEETPKAVWAALAISALANSCELDGAIQDGDEQALAVAVCAEWATLHRAGIVPQPPPNPERIIFGAKVTTP
jgi:hypothetical protein